MTQFNGARLAVLRSRLDGIARKMTATLLRAGRSGVLNRAKDLSCCIMTRDCELLVSGDSLPIHVLSGPDLMTQAMLEAHPRPRRGDAYLHNSPYHGCSHAADHTLMVPVIDKSGAHHFTVLAKAHQADIGNSIPTTYFATAADVYQEGALIFPAVKVQDDYRTNEDIVRMCRMRIRVPDQWHGDFLAMIGAARCGEQELLALAAEIGWDMLHDFSAQWLDYSEGRAKAAIARLPAGRFSGQSTHDPMPGTPPGGLTLKAHVRIDPEVGKIEVDLRDNQDCLPCGLNVSESCARTAALIGVFNCLGADIPKNAGSFRRVSILLRDGSIAGGGQHPVSFSVATTNVADRIAAAVQLALGQCAGVAGVAEVGAINPPHKGVISGIDRTGKPFVNQLFLGSTGGPASAHVDGWLTYSHAGNGGVCFVDSVEMAELHHPIVVHSRTLLANTEGAGEYSGAPSLSVEFGPVGTPLSVAYVSDGVLNPAQGIQGGHAGGGAHQIGPSSNALPNVGQLQMQPGETVISTGTGGGGYGPPHQRDPRLVQQNVADRLVTPERAEQIYAVRLTAAGEVDFDATRQLRQKRTANQ